MVLNKNGRVVFISAMSEDTETGATAAIYKGRVDSIIQIGGEYWVGITDFDGTQITRPAASGIGVNDSGSQKDISSLNKGDYVEVKVSDNKIIEINSLVPGTVQGTVTSVRPAAITVHSDSGTDVDLEVPDSVVVVKNNSTMAYNDVKEGNRVEITVVDNKSVRINILSSPSLEGVIKELDTTGTYVITIRDDSGDTRDYVVVSDAEVMQDGSRIYFDNLRVGDRVRLELNSRNRVVYIELVGSESSKLTGEIVDLDTTGTWGITIRNDDGDTLDYVVLSDVEVIQDGSHINFDDLCKGERVKLELSSRNRVDYIEVIDENYSTISGKVADLSTGSSRWIKIEKSDGSKKRYYMADSVVIKRDGESIRQRDIVIGSEVEIQVGSGIVKKITVINDEDISVSGTVTYVSTSNKKITIQQVSGNEFSYYLADGARLRDGSNRSISLYDIEEGCDVQLELDGGKIIWLTKE